MCISNGLEKKLAIALSFYKHKVAAINGDETQKHIQYVI